MISGFKEQASEAVNSAAKQAMEKGLDGAYQAASEWIGGKKEEDL